MAPWATGRQTRPVATLDLRLELGDDGQRADDSAVVLVDVVQAVLVSDFYVLLLLEAMCTGHLEQWDALLAVDNLQLERSRVGKHLNIEHRLVNSLAGVAMVTLENYEVEFSEFI